MKKNNSLKLFNKLAKRAYKVSKKRKLGWKWSDAQKWTSANLFQKYKGTKNRNETNANLILLLLSHFTINREISRMKNTI
jgi:hypothetical protein